MAQKQNNWYEALARATGGQVSPVKGKKSWYLIEFKWHKSGKWQLIDKEGKITVKTAHGRRKVNRLPINMAQEILGVWIAPSGCSKQQTKALQKKTEAWADCIRS
eukprot:8417136-Ditylum_brightwellii.AAC.1